MSDDAAPPALDRAADAAPDREDGRILRGEATRERVLDAAERLFAQHGFEGVSIRQIAREAGVTLSVVGFHGGSKDDLSVTVLERRAAALNARRRAALAAAMAEPDPTLRAVIEAYVLPYTRMVWSGDRQWGAYARLIARIATDEEWYPRVSRLFDPVAQEFLSAIVALRADIPRDRLAVAFVLSVTGMLSVASSRARIAALSRSLGATAARDPDWHDRVLVDYVEGGIRGALRLGD
ncbi:MAG: TetR family transcriptional regulator [Rhodobacteraceae bacterium]|nr:TetR family transcriptional regulator [Paracoccaceae bacterium]